jgi:hypothetical protein
MAHEEDDEEYWEREAARRGIHVPSDKPAPGPASKPSISKGIKGGETKIAAAARIMGKTEEDIREALDSGSISEHDIDELLKENPLTMTDEEEEEPDPDFPEDEDAVMRRKFMKKKAGIEEEEEIPLPKRPAIPTHRPGSPIASPIGPGPGGAKTPPPPPPPMAPPAKPGECCPRMKKEIGERTNVTLYKDRKDNDIVVFAHNFNKILHCPWCGARI